MYEPEWLASPGLNQLYLAPVAGSDSAPVIMSPSLGGQPEPAWSHRFVEVTGHFDDPAAGSCHWTPGPAALLYYAGQRGVVDACRMQFVITAVTVLADP